MSASDRGGYHAGAVQVVGCRGKKGSILPNPLLPTAARKVKARGFLPESFTVPAVFMTTDGSRPRPDMSDLVGRRL